MSVCKYTDGMTSTQCSDSKVLLTSNQLASGSGATSYTILEGLQHESKWDGFEVELEAPEGVWAPAEIAVTIGSDKQTAQNLHAITAGWIASGTEPQAPCASYLPGPQPTPLERTLKAGNPVH